jgi:hypothetical protein
MRFREDAAKQIASAIAFIAVAAFVLGALTGAVVSRL